MGELWRDLAETLRRRPVLWVPVLVADLLGYGLNLLRNGFLHAVLLHETTQRSVLGGAVIRTVPSAAQLQRTAVLGLLFSWLTYLLRMLLYSAAFVGTAALVRAALRREERPGNALWDTLQSSWSGILELALRGLAVYAVAALLFSSMTSSLAKHGNGAVLRHPLFGFALTLVVLTVLCLTLPPVALRVLTGTPPDRAGTRLARQFAFVLVFIAAVLASFVSTNSRELALVPVAARYALEVAGSLIVALPYVLLYVGLALLARRYALRGGE